MVVAPEAPAKWSRAKRTREAVNDSLREIQVGSAAKLREPTIVERDDLSRELLRRDPRSAFRGRVYFWWMEHDDSGGCDRNPVTDPHEDLAYVGKTLRDLFVRWGEHLAPGKIDGDTGERKANNSAVYRHRRQITGVSADPRIYDTPEALAGAEARAIKNLWPAWNIQEQDRRNPHSRASRSYRRPDRLAPLIGLASVLWGLVWALITCGLYYVILLGTSAWYWIIAAPLIGLYITNGTAYRHAKRLASHKSRSYRRFTRSKAGRKR
jgi:hypothetical protein